MVTALCPAWPPGGGYFTVGDGSQLDSGLYCPHKVMSVHYLPTSVCARERDGRQRVSERECVSHTADYDYIS